MSERSEKPAPSALRPKPAAAPIKKSEFRGEERIYTEPRCGLLLPQNPNKSKVKRERERLKGNRAVKAHIIHYELNSQGQRNTIKQSTHRGHQITKRQKLFLAIN